MRVASTSRLHAVLPSVVNEYAASLLSTIRNSVSFTRWYVRTRFRYFLCFPRWGQWAASLTASPAVISLCSLSIKRICLLTGFLSILKRSDSCSFSTAIAESGSGIALISLPDEFFDRSQQVQTESTRRWPSIPPGLWTRWYRRPLTEKPEHRRDRCRINALRRSQGNIVPLVGLLLGFVVGLCPY